MIHSDGKPTISSVPRRQPKTLSRSERAIRSAMEPLDLALGFDVPTPVLSLLIEVRDRMNNGLVEPISLFPSVSAVVWPNDGDPLD